MSLRSFTLCITSLLLCSTIASSQEPKKSGVLLATFLHADLAGDSSGLWSHSGAHTYRDGEHRYVWTILIKDEQGRHLLFPTPKEYKITAKGKQVKEVESGSKIAVTFSPRNPLLVQAIDVLEEGKNQRRPEVYQIGRFAALKDNLLTYERRDQLLRVMRLDKDATVTVGRNSIRVEDIQPGQEIVLTQDPGKPLAITMLPDDSGRVAIPGLRVAAKRSPDFGLEVVVPGPRSVAVSPELLQKMVQDLKGMPSLNGLSLGRPGSQTRSKNPMVMPEATWTKAAEQLGKFQTPFTLNLNIESLADDTSGLAQLQNLNSLTLREYGPDFGATLKKMLNLKSLTIEIDSDADLAKVVDHPALTGLILGGDITRSVAVTDAGMKQLKRAAKLTHLTIASGAKVTPAGFKEIDGLRQLRNLTIAATAVKGFKNNQGIRALTLRDATDETLKDACDMKGLQELRLLFPSKITDAGLKSLKSLKNLEKLQLEATAVTGTGLRELRDLKTLATLELQIGLTDEAMAELKNLSSVRHLKLAARGGDPKDVGIHVKDMKELESLDLRGARIGDAGLEHFRNLKKLTWLQLPYNPGTPAMPGLGLKAVEDFAKAMPNCEYGVLGSGGDFYSRSSKSFRMIPSPF